MRLMKHGGELLLTLPLFCICDWLLAVDAEALAKTKKYIPQA